MDEEEGERGDCVACAGDGGVDEEVLREGEVAGGEGVEGYVVLRGGGGREGLHCVESGLGLRRGGRWERIGVLRGKREGVTPHCGTFPASPIWGNPTQAP